MTHPNIEDVEVILFGPGFGECILLHVGSRNWIIVDSCLNDEKQPAGSKYLKSIGVNLAKEVVAVVATHWDNDHIAGMFETLERCESAKFVCSSVLRDAEFYAFLKVHDNLPTQSLGKAGTEIRKCLHLVKERNSAKQTVKAATNIQEWDKGALAHGERAQLVALSPSEKQYEEFLKWVTNSLNAEKDEEGQIKIARTRLVGHTRNDLSIASILTVGDFSILLGADVEERGDPELGWSAIVTARRERKPKSMVYKVPHHGSPGAHLDEVWSDLLADEPVAIVTPWRLGGNSLPGEADKARIKAHAGNAYITSDEPVGIKRKYSREVRKLIGFSGVEIAPVTFKCGAIKVTIDVAKAEIKDIHLIEPAKLL